MSKIDIQEHDLTLAGEKYMGSALPSVGGCGRVWLYLPLLSYPSQDSTTNYLKIGVPFNNLGIPTVELFSEEDACNYR